MYPFYNDGEDLENVKFLRKDMTAELKKLGLSNIGDLYKTQFRLLFERSSKKYLICETIRRLHKQGFYSPCIADIKIEDMGFSSRITKVLGKEGIVYLSQLEYYSKEQLNGFRLIGEVSIIEIINKSKAYNLNIYSLTPIKKRFIGYGLPSKIFENFFYYGISCPGDFENRTTMDLYELCDQDYELTDSLYKILENKVIWSPWESIFIFELLSSYKSLRLWEALRIERVHDLCNFTERQIISVRGITPAEISQLLEVMNKFDISYKSK